MNERLLLSSIIIIATILLVALLLSVYSSSFSTTSTPRRIIAEPPSKLILDNPNITINTSKVLLISNNITLVKVFKSKGINALSPNLVTKTNHSQLLQDYEAIVIDWDSLISLNNATITSILALCSKGLAIGKAVAFISLRGIDKATLGAVLARSPRQARRTCYGISAYLLF